MAIKLVKKLHSLFDRKFVNQIESNFEDIEHYMNKAEEQAKTHKTTEKHAHTSDQIDHVLKNGAKWTVREEQNYIREQILGLVLGHNGDGVQELRASRISMDAKRFGDLSNRLSHDFLTEANKREAQYKDLLGRIMRTVNVDDYGADRTGQKDSSEAIRKAIGDGGRTVHFSNGTYLIDQGIKIPNNTIITGESAQTTIIKLSKKAPRETIGLTNAKMSGEAYNISIENLTIDGNKEERFPETTGIYKYAKPSGGSLSSNIRLAGVTNGYVRKVRSKDALLHGIDVTFASDDYYYQGDGNRVDVNLESRNIIIDGCEVFGFGDDGITTHHSRDITISNCYAHNTKNYHGNSNGFEIDDGSQMVIMNNNVSYANYSGLEIKAHQTSSAGSKVLVNNHMSIKDCRAFNPRHIGHHRRASDDVSKTAKDVVLNNCMALYPYNNEVYPGMSARALVISAYKNITVNNFIAVGDSAFPKDMPAIAIQFMANNVTLNNPMVRGFTNALADIKIYGGANRGSNIIINNANIAESSRNRGIAGGSKVEGVKIVGGNLQGVGTGTGVELYNTKATLTNVSATGYATPAIVSKEKHSIVPNMVKGGAVLGSSGSLATKERSAVIASSGGCHATHDRAIILASGDNSKAVGSRDFIGGSLNSVTEKDGHSRWILPSNRVKNTQNYHVVGGWGEKGAPSEKNIKFDASMYSGNLEIAGKLKQNGADYAEYFESQSGTPIPLGSIVALDGDKIRKAQSNDELLGVISGTATVIGDSANFHHKDRYLKDEYGVEIKKQVDRVMTREDGTEYIDTIFVPVENPDYDEDTDYVPRSERPEWQAVGLLGKIYTNVDKNVKVGDKLIAKAGIGYTDNVNGQGKVMKITTPYTDERGHAIAIVMWGGK